MQAATRRLASAIARHATVDGMHPSPVTGLWLIRSDQPTEPLHLLHEPAVCIVAQGAKQVLVGDQVHHYNPAEYLVVSVDLPLAGHVTEASPDAPYLCLRLDLDADVLASLMVEAGLRPAAPASPPPGLHLGPTTPELMDAATRLVQLLDAPHDIRALAPLLQRELHYRLLTGPHGAAVQAIALADPRAQQVGRAISWIKANYAKPFSIDVVAREAHLSASALHAHFKAVTALTPLQYQKQLRLQEARRLMVAQARDAASVAFAVGYESSSQFSREYSRLFGASPARDVARVRASLRGTQDLAAAVR